MTLYTGHGGSGSMLHFASTAAGDLPGVRVETKYCELCGRMYVRPVDAEARAGRDCDRCIARKDLQRAQEAAELRVARQQGVRMPAVQ